MQKFVLETGFKFKITVDNSLRLETKIMQMRNQNHKAKWKDSQVYLKNGGIFLYSFTYREVRHAVWGHYVDFIVTKER